MNVFEIPLSPESQRFDVTLKNIDYNMLVVWNGVALCWVLDIYDSNNVPLVTGIPMVTGSDLLAQFDYLGFGGGLVVTTDSNVGVPTFEGLGETGHLYFIVPDASDVVASSEASLVDDAGRVIIPPTDGPSA